MRDRARLYLGPILFAMFIAPMEDNVKDIVAFADDNYNISSSKYESVAMDKCIEKTKVMMKWMSGSGLKVNSDKK